MWIHRRKTRLSLWDPFVKCVKEKQWDPWKNINSIPFHPVLRLCAAAIYSIVMHVHLRSAITSLASLVGRSFFGNGTCSRVGVGFTGLRGGVMFMMWDGFNNR